jgi:hypothetical protein
LFVEWLHILQFNFNCFQSICNINWLYNVPCLFTKSESKNWAIFGFSDNVNDIFLSSAVFCWKDIDDTLELISSFDSSGKDDSTVGETADMTINIISIFKYIYLLQQES